MLTNKQITRMKGFHKRVILTQMGLRPSSIPKKISDINDILVRMNEDELQTKKLEQLYRVVVLGEVAGPQLPTDVAEQVNRAKMELAAAIKNTTVEELIGQADARVRDLMEKAQADLIRHAKEAITKAADNYRPIVVKQGKKTKKLKGVFPAEFERMLQLASSRVPQMWVGPAGCGKTYMAAKVAEALDLPFYDQSCSEGISESNFTGWLLPVGAGGKFEYVPAPFVIAYESGGVFLLDEMDAADPNLLVFLNKAIANDSFFVPARHKKPLVKKHPNFVVIAAANTYGAGADAQYVGRNALDASTLDRYRTGLITMDYSPAVEEALVDQEILEWGRKIRKLIRERKLYRIMSTRVMLDLTKMKVEHEWDKEDWEEAYFADWSVEERRMVA